VQGEHSAAARRTQVLRLQVLVEPGEIAAHRDVPARRAEAPGFPAREVRVRVGAEGGDVPALGGVGAEEHSTRSEVGEVAILVGASRRVVQIVERARHALLGGGTSGLCVGAGGQSGCHDDRGMKRRSAAEYGGD